jgi:hypothetical protein
MGRTRGLIRRAGPALAAIMLPLGLGGCAHLFAQADGDHRLHRYRSGQCRPGNPLDGVYLRMAASQVAHDSCDDAASPLGLVG